MLKKYLLVVALVFSFTIAPAALADTVSDLQAQINAVLAQIRNLQVQLNASQAGSTVTGDATVGSGSGGGGSGSGFCFTFARGLSVGSSFANDVTALTSVLSLEGFLDGKSDIYDEDVAAAVVDFQTKYGIQKTGTVGPKTRAKLNSLYGCGNSTQFSLSSKSVETKNGTDVLYTVNLSTASQRSSGSWTLSLSCPVGITAVTQIRGGLGCGDIAKISSGSTVEVLFNNSTNVSQTIGATAQLLSGKDDTTPIATDRDALTIQPDANIGANQPSINEFRTSHPLTDAVRSTTLVWNVSNAERCVLSGPNFSTEQGYRTSEAISTGILTSDSTFTLTCTNTSGLSASKSLTVWVPTLTSTQPSINVDVRINGQSAGSSVKNGDTFTLSYTATGATYCRRDAKENV